MREYSNQIMSRKKVFGRDFRWPTFLILPHHHEPFTPPQSIKDWIITLAIFLPYPIYRLWRYYVHARDEKERANAKDLRGDLPAGADE